MRSELMKLIKSGRFPNEKNRVWTMCQVALHMATLAADEAEKLKLTDEQFYINFEDALNILSALSLTISEGSNKIAAVSFAEVPFLPR